MQRHQFLCNFGVGAQTYEQRIKALSPVAYWPLSEASGTTIVDSINAYNGSYAGGVTVAALTSRFNKPAPDFVGVNGYGNLQGAGLAAAFGGLAGSFSFWEKLDATKWPNTTRYEFLRFFADVSNFVFGRKDSAAYQLLFQYNAAGTTESVTRVLPEAFVDWINFTLTWSKANERVILYENGWEVGRSINLGSWTGSPATSLLGASTTTPTLVMDGGLSDVALWTRELTPTEALIVADNAGKNIPVFFGDSITVGTGATTVPQRWVNLVAASQGYGYFINSGISATVLQNTTQNTVAVIGGAATNNGRDTYTTRVTKYIPSKVFVLYGFNDLRLNDAAFTTANFQNDLGEVVDGIITAGTSAQNVIIGSPPHLSNYAAGSPYNGGSAIKHDQYRDACAAVATAKGTKYIDVYQWMLDNGGDALISGDGIHPNDAGHDAIADAFISVL